MTGTEQCAVACGEVGNVVVGVGVAGSSVACWQLSFGVEAGRCMGLEGMDCRVDYGQVKNLARRVVEVSPAAQRLSSSCVVGGGGRLLIVEAVKALLVGLTPVAVVLQEEWSLARLQM